jgi:hypothetical protein
MKTVYLDIETAPNLGYVWAKYEQNVLAYERERYLLCFTYLWQGTSKVRSCAQWDYPARFKADPFDDRAVLIELWNVLDEADVIIGHNLDKFDLRMANSFFVRAGLGSPSPYQTIDTLKVARRYFAFNSNKLGDLVETLGIGEKLNAGGFETWLGCMAGDPRAQRRMVKYARRDTAILPALYEALRPWMKGHPSMNHDDPEACPVCATRGSLTKDGWRYTKVGKYQGYYCSACGSYPSSRTAEKVEHKPERVSR